MPIYKAEIVQRHLGGDVNEYLREQCALLGGPCEVEVIADSSLTTPNRSHRHIWRNGYIDFNLVTPCIQDFQRQINRGGFLFIRLVGPVRVPQEVMV